MRDPSHARLLAPVAWKEHCAAHGLEVRTAELQALKQPDLEWYFETAATSAESRTLVRALVAAAPAEVHSELRLGEEDGKTVWWWPRLTLIAQKTVGRSPR